MTKLRLFFALGLVFVAVVFWVQNSEHMAIDSCLDSGGRWDYDDEDCAGG